LAFVEVAQNQEARAESLSDGGEQAVVSGETLAAESDRLAAELRLSDERSAMYELLGFIDEVCQRHSIGYFLFSDTLQGAVYYGDFVPGSSVVYLGMLREDWEHFAVVAGPLAMERGYLFETMCGEGDVPRRMPRLGVVRSVGSASPSDADPGASGERCHCLELSVFDSIPDSFDVRRGHFRRMKRLNRRSVGIARARAWVRGERRIKSAKEFVRTLRYLPCRRAANARRLLREAQRYNGKGMADVTRLAGDRTRAIARNRLTPYRHLPFGPLQLNGPADDSAWVAEATEEAMVEVRRLQHRMLEILGEFDRVCRILGIGYFVCGGTMLGYVRHGGFIPWDDDIDVGMLREDYERFREEAAAHLGERFFLQTRESDPNIPYLFTKIRLNGTEYITAYNQNRVFHKGICLDIFPFDAIPEGEEAQRRFKRRVRKRARRHHRVVNRQVPPVEYATPPRDFEEWWFRLFGRVHRCVYWHIPLKWTQRRYDRLVTRYNTRAASGGSGRVASFVPTYTHVALDDLLPYRDVKFEGLTVKVPYRPEVFLEMQYGDYMSLPPVHKRVGHGLLRWGDVDERDSVMTDL